jgi:hypothetical protein
MSFGSNHQYLECIKSAYDFASGELLTLMKDKVITVYRKPRVTLRSFIS